MPYSALDGEGWENDPKLIASFDGSSKIENWFGYFPSFHDWNIATLKFAEDKCVVEFDAFHMTNKTNSDGYFIDELHAAVTIRLEGVTGVAIKCPANTQVLEVGFRKLEKLSSVPSDAYVSVGDIEVCFDDVFGRQSSLFAKTVSLDLMPRTA